MLMYKTNVVYIYHNLEAVFIVSGSRPVQITSRHLLIGDRVQLGFETPQRSGWRLGESGQYFWNVPIGGLRYTTLLGKHSIFVYFEQSHLQTKLLTVVGERMIAADKSQLGKLLRQRNQSNEHGATLHQADSDKAALCVLKAQHTHFLGTSDAPWVAD